MEWKHFFRKTVQVSSPLSPFHQNKQKKQQKKTKKKNKIPVKNRSSLITVYYHVMGDAFIIFAISIQTTFNVKSCILNISLCVWTIFFSFLFPYWRQNIHTCLSIFSTSFFYILIYIYINIPLNPIFKQWYHIIVPIIYII